MRTIDDMDSSSHYKIYAGFLLFSLSTLTYELLISRVMSVVAWYHFAFMAICLALFGMTVGAVIVYKYKEFLLKQLHRALFYSSLIFSVSLILNLVLICFFPVFISVFQQETNILIYYPLHIFLIFSSFVIPLTGFGVCVSLIFSKYVDRANQIYFVNLAGSSLGCLFFIPIINSFGVVNSYFFLAFLGVVAAYLFSRDQGSLGRIFLWIVSLSVIFVPILNDQTGLLDLHWTKGKLDNQAFFKKWNPFSYIRLVGMAAKTIPIGWGFAPKKRDEIHNIRIEQIYLDIDAMAGTVMTNFEDRNVKNIDYLRYDITALPYYLVHNGNVLVIGIGAGRDILTGLLFNQKSITGVEINDTILEIHQKLLAKFNGNLSQHPKVKFIHNEARSFINSTQQKFDLIQLSLIDTFAATQAGAYALTENNLYTIEALKIYYDHLTQKGFFSIAYWLNPGSPESMLKLTAAATEALRRAGIINPRAHMVIIHKEGLDDANPYAKKSPLANDGRGVANLLVKKEMFTSEELTVIKNYCDEMGFHFILSPDFSQYASFAKMSDVHSFHEYAQHCPLNIAPASDDKPFFFLTKRLNFNKFLQDFKFLSFSAEYILFSLLVFMIALTCLFVVFPLLKAAQFSQLKIPVLTVSIYFTAIGLAFMFIEMTQLTRLSSFLGHPVYSLSIVLFSFLIGSGLGSNFLGKIDQKRTVVIITTLFVAICLLSSIFTVPLLGYFSKYPTGLRMIIAIVLVFPLAFFMGAFLPQGIRYLGQQNGPVALFWGLNGAASVLGSILAMISQISMGLNMTFLLGVMCYIVAILILYRLKY